MTKLHDVALYMPTTFCDFSRCVTDFNPNRLIIGEGTFQGTLASAPSTTFKRGQPLTKFSLTDGYNILKFTLFGDVRKLIEEITKPENAANPLNVFGELVFINQVPYINGAKLITSDQVGKIIPVYPGVAGKVKPETMARLIKDCIDEALPLATDVVRKVLSEAFPNQKALRNFLNIPHGLTLDQVLAHIHYPTSMDTSTFCLNLMKRIATIVAGSDILKMAQQAKLAPPVPGIIGPSIDQLTKRIPFKPTEEQVDIVVDAIDSIARGSKLNLLIVADVGFGKSVVYFMIAAYIAYSGERVAIMLPNGNLARQIFNEFEEYYPDLRPLFVSADDGLGTEVLGAKVLIGTTALLFRDVGKFSLVVFDESQKLGVAQQQQLLTEHTHSISVSATPIPRTLALSQYGAVNIAKITKCHVEKTIFTRVMKKEQYDQLINEVLWCVNSLGKQALIVCTRKEDGEDDDESALISVEQMAAEFENRLPGLVAVSHGGLQAHENELALNSMRDGSKRVLVATTVVEVGVTLPELSYAVVMNADRLGLAQCHQIRGRLARKGGTAWFSLYVSREISSSSSIERLNTLATSIDGFEISRMDLKIRGVGDLNHGTMQHGAYVGLIRNMKIDIDELESAVDYLNSLN